MNNPDYLYWAEHHFDIVEQCDFALATSRPMVMQIKNGAIKDPNLYFLAHLSRKQIYAKREHNEQFMWFNLLMQAEHDLSVKPKRDRGCKIKATSLNEILDTCDRHIQNINMTLIDMCNEGDVTETDRFYCKMFADSWSDLRDDVEAMLKKRSIVRKQSPKVNPYVVAKSLKGQAAVQALIDAKIMNKDGTLNKRYS